MMRVMAGLRITTIFTFMCILSTLQISFAQRFDVTVTETPVFASQAGAVDLACQVSPAVSAELMTIKYHRGDPLSYVDVYNRSRKDPGNQNKMYKGRTHFLTQNITQGEVTLRIYNVQWSDKGNYICLFVSYDYHKAGTVELQMTGNNHNSGASGNTAVIVSCVLGALLLLGGVAGVMWYIYKKKAIQRRMIKYRNGDDPLFSDIQ